jgi:hypothetical protein
MARDTNVRLFVLTACTVAIAACGSTANTGTNGANSDQALVYVQCLRSHGVPNFPDPTPGGRLPNVPSNINTAAPAFRSAQNACARLMPGGSGRVTASASGALLAVARCMRKHGLPNFSDPTTSPPPPPPTDSAPGTVIGGPGGYLAFPPSSPALTRAMAACGFRLP